MNKHTEHTQLRISASDRELTLERKGNIIDAIDFLRASTPDTDTVKRGASAVVVPQRVMMEMKSEVVQHEEKTEKDEIKQEDAVRETKCSLCKLNHISCTKRGQDYWFCARHLVIIDKTLANMKMESEGYAHHDGKILRGITTNASLHDQITTMLPTLQRNYKMNNTSAVRERMSIRAEDVCDGYDSEELDELAAQGLRPGQEGWAEYASEVLAALYAQLEDEEGGEEET